MDQTVIDAAVKELEWGQSSHIPFDGEYYQGLVFNYRDFIEHLCGDVAARIYTTLEPLFDDPAADHSELLREHLRLGGPRKGAKKDVVVEITNVLNAAGTPRFFIEVSSEPFRDGKAARITVRDDRGEDYPEHIANLTVFTGERFRGSAFCDATAFQAFVQFVNAYVAAVPHLRDTYLGLAHGGLLNDEFMALRDADGGVLGEHVLAAFDTYLTRAAAHVCDWAAGVLVEVQAAQSERGFVWGGKYLIHNDLDDSSCAVPTGVPGRVAVMHDNTSLMSDYRRFLAWVDQDEGGKPHSLSVRMLLAEENLAKAVADLRADKLAATLEYDLESRSLVKSATFYESNLMEMFPFYLNVDHGLFAMGKVDQDDFRGEVGTDFTRLEQENEEDFDEDGEGFDDDQEVSHLP